MNIGKLDWHQLSRRRFLLASVATAAALVGCEADSPRDVQVAAALDGDAGMYALLVFSATQARTLQAFAEAVLPAAQGWPSVAEVEMLRRFDEELFFVDEAIRQDVAAALDVLEWLPLVRGHLSRFSELPVARRAGVIEGMMTSRLEILQAIANNLKVVCQFFYYAHPATWPSIGYEGTFAGIEPKESEQRRYYRMRSGQA